MKKMVLKEITMAFGMTVEQFAKRTGYTRQHLYQSTLKPTTRAKAAIASLRDLNDLMFKMEQEEAQRRFEARSKAVKEFEQLILKAGEIDGH